MHLFDAMIDFIYTQTMPRQMGLLDLMYFYCGSVELMLVHQSLIEVYCREALTACRKCVCKCIEGMMDLNTLSLFLRLETIDTQIYAAVLKRRYLLLQISTYQQSMGFLTSAKKIVRLQQQAGHLTLRLVNQNRGF